MKTGFLFDLDGTITTTELLPCIASVLNATDEIATLTKLTMDGHIAFADSMRLRCLILGQIPLGQVHSVVESVPLEPSIVEFINDRSSECIIVTGNLDIWLAPLMNRLKCRWFTSKAVSDQSRLRLTSILDKGQVMKDIKASNEFTRHVAIGDGANDTPMLEQADIGIAYGGVHTPAPGSVSVSKILINSSESLCNLLKGL